MLRTPARRAIVTRYLRARVMPRLCTASLDASAFDARIPSPRSGVAGDAEGGRCRRKTCLLFGVGGVLLQGTGVNSVDPWLSRAECSDG